jgi:phosphohistidine phosphatase
MPKQLLLIRHAKSDWNNAGLKDFDRPLNKRGHSNAPEMANRMVEQQIIPDLIVSSPALRAITTATYFAENWGIDQSKIQQENSIYEANVKSLLALVNQLDNQFDHVAMLGHNPGLTDFANYLSDVNIYNMPTCSIVIIEFPFENWNEVSAETGKVVLFDYPKSLDD